MYANRSLKVKEIVVHFKIDSDIAERERVDIIEIVFKINIVTDLNSALPGNSSVNTVQHTTIEEAVFSMSAVMSHSSR
jgi:hypothetical protein